MNYIHVLFLQTSSGSLISTFVFPRQGFFECLPSTKFGFGTAVWTIVRNCPVLHVQAVSRIRNVVHSTHMLQPLFSYTICQILCNVSLISKTEILPDSNSITCYRSKFMSSHYFHLIQFYLCIFLFWFYYSLFRFKNTRTFLKSW